MLRAPKRGLHAVTAMLALAGLVGSGVGLATASTASGTPPLAFDLQQSLLRSSPKKVFAHYMPSMPLSYDNTDASADYWTRSYLNPDGEKGIHKAYGGFTRDAPSVRVARTGDWKLANMQEEVRQAIAAGIDGFTVDLLSVEPTNYNWTNTKVLMQAAASIDPAFTIMLVPDMTTSVGSKSQVDLARSMAELAASPAAYRLADGRLVISPFKAENHDAAWWATFLATMKGTYGIDVAFVPMFLDERPYLGSFASISYGMSVWGNRNPQGNDVAATGSSSPVGRVQAVHDRGLIWMQPVSYQDERPRSGIFDEAENTTNLRATWQLATVTKSEWVQLVTWNDYAEGSQLAPSIKHGWSPLDINAYYLTRYKTGVAPTIVRDTVYLTHRVQPVAAKPSYPQTLLMALRGGSSPARDGVEALTFVTKPSTVIVTVGSTSTSCSVPAGVGVCVVALGGASLDAGTISARVVRSGFTTASVTSPHAVTTAPRVQDFQYVSVSSGREGTSAAEPVTTTPTPSTPTPSTPTPSTPTPSTPTPSTPTSSTPTSSTPTPSTPTPSTPTPSTPTPTSTTEPPAKLVVRLEPVADAYANEAAAASNYGSSRLLASRGTAGNRSYLRFAVPVSPQGKKLVSAVLTVRTSNHAAAGSTARHTVRLAGNSWGEATLTWRKRPAITSTVLGTINGASTRNRTYSTSLAVARISPLAGTRATMTLISSGRDNLWIWSAEQASRSLRPQLVLTYG